MLPIYRRLAPLMLPALPLSSVSLAMTPPSPGHLERIAIAEHVAEASQRFGIPEDWIHAVIRVESAGRTRAISTAGAMGLMQLMPATWARQRERLGLGTDPFDPRDNVLAGTAYLKEMHDLYGQQGFLAAYNAGPGRYEDWLLGRRSLPRETRRYLARIALVLPGLAGQEPGGLEPVRSQDLPASATTPAKEAPTDPRQEIFVPVQTLPAEDE